MARPSNREQLVAELSRARKAKGLSIRNASALIGLPASTLQGWFEGKHLPTQALTPKFLDLLVHLGLISSDDDRAGWASTLDALRSVRLVAEAPYAGLRPYRADQATLYFGREKSLAHLVEACLRPSDEDTSRIVILLGESGSGKSSLLAAGLIGQETAGQGALSHLKPVRVTPAEVESIQASPVPTLLVVDQFEDLDQLEPDTQRDVMQRLSHLPPHTVCVLGLRADAIGLAMRDEWLAQDLSTPVVLGPVSSDAFVRIIEQPALRHGRSVTPELTQLLLRDIYAYGEPAPGVVLPLLSSALRRCWEDADGSTLTPTDYLATGGLWAALDQEADEIYEPFSPEEQRLARRLLLSLFNVDGAAALRRRIAASALSPALLAVAEPFIASRILTRNDDHIEVAHDALLLHWKRLADWVEEARTTLLLGRRIHLAAQLWDEGGRTSDALMPAEAQLWRTWAESGESTVLSMKERAFIDASCELGEATVVEQARTISRIRRRQMIALVAGGLAVVMAIAALTAFLRSEDFRRKGEATTAAAQSRQVALISDEVRSTSVNLAGQLSVASMSLDDNVQSRSSVLTSAAADVPVRAVGPTGNTMLALTPDGTTIVRADSAGDLSIWRGGDLRDTPEKFASGGGQLYALSLKQVQGHILVAVGGQQTAAVWDITSTPRKLVEFGQDTVGYSATWQESTVLIGTLEGTVRRFELRDLANPVSLPELSIGEKTQVSAVAANGNWILASGRRDRIEVFGADGSSHEPLASPGTVLTLSASPDGSAFLSGSTLREARLWDGATLAKGTGIATEAGVNSATHLGDTLLIAGGFGAVGEYNASGQLLRTFPGRSVVTSVAAGGHMVAVGSTEGETTAWSIPDDQVILRSPEGVAHYDVIRSRAGLLIGTLDGAVMMARSGAGWKQLPVDPAPDGSGYNPYYSIDAAGDLLVNQTRDGNLVTLGLRDGRYRVLHQQPMATGLVDIQLSPDGRYLVVGYRGKAGSPVYRASDGGWTLVGNLASWPSSSAFNADGTLFVAMTIEGKGFNLWSVDEGGFSLVSSQGTQHDVVPISFAFAPDGTMAIGDDAGVVTLYDVSDPRSPRAATSLGDARSSLSQLQFSEDGNRLLAASRSGVLWVWARTHGSWTLDLMLRPGGDSVTGVDLFDGRFVISLDDGRTVSWEDDPAEARTAMCARFGSRLDAAEWERLVPGVPFVDGCA